MEVVELVELVELEGVEIERWGEFVATSSTSSVSQGREVQVSHQDRMALEDTCAPAQLVAFA